MTTDNASSNKKMIAMMAKKLKRDNKNFTSKRHIPRFAHILNLVVQSSIKSFDIPSASHLMEEEGDEQLTMLVIWMSKRMSMLIQFFKMRVRYRR